MANHVDAELQERYRARAAFFWQRVRDSRFKEWQKLARSASWGNLVWDWESLGISEVAREAAESLEFVPSEVFAHPDVITGRPELIDYYRLMSCLPKKGLAQLSPGASGRDRVTLCRLLNNFLCFLLVATAKTNREALLNTIFAEAGTEWQGIWVNEIGLRAARALEQILATFGEQKGIVDIQATKKLVDERQRGLVLKSGTVLRFGSEPDIECRTKTKDLICVIEIKGSADKAGAQTRLGETKKSFTKAKLENPRCHTIFIPSVLTPAVREQLRTERDIDQVFDLLGILKDENTRTAFLTEFFKFRLREEF